MKKLTGGVIPLLVLLSLSLKAEPVWRDFFKWKPSSEWEEIFPQLNLKAGVSGKWLEGKVKFTREKEGKQVGETLDLVDELNFEVPSLGMELGLAFTFASKHRLVVTYQQSRYRGKVDLLQKDLEFAGKVFTGKIENALLLDQLGIYYQYLFYPFPRLCISPLVGIENYFLGIMLKSEDLDLRVIPTIYLPIPALGVSSFYRLGKGFGLYADFRGIGIAGWQEAGWLPIPFHLLAVWSGINNFNIYYFQTELGFNYQFRRINLGISYLLSQSGAKIEYEEEDKYDYFRVGEQGILLWLRLNF